MFALFPLLTFFIPIIIYYLVEENLCRYFLGKEAKTEKFLQINPKLMYLSYLISFVIYVIVTVSGFILSKNITEFLEKNLFLPSIPHFELWAFNMPFLFILFYFLHTILQIIFLHIKAKKIMFLFIINAAAILRLSLICILKDYCYHLSFNISQFTKKI